MSDEEIATFRSACEADLAKSAFAGVKLPTCSKDSDAAVQVYIGMLFLCVGVCIWAGVGFMDIEWEQKSYSDAAYHARINTFAVWLCVLYCKFASPFFLM